MDVPPEPRITAVDRLANSVIITFDDGRCAVFSASLLHETLPHAQYVTDFRDHVEAEF